jgi:hypothetical protein
MEKKSRLKIEKVEKESSNENEKNRTEWNYVRIQNEKRQNNKKNAKKKKKQKLTARLVVVAHAGRSWSWAAIAFRERQNQNGVASNICFFLSVDFICFQSDQRVDACMGYQQVAANPPPPAVTHEAKKYVVKTRNICVEYSSLEMIWNDKSLNNKVVNLVENYNFLIQFISIKFKKRVIIFLNMYSLYRWKCYNNAIVPCAEELLTAVSNRDRA